MSDVTLSLGSRWRSAEIDRERQGQTIAHLTNQLEGLKSVTHISTSKRRGSEPRGGDLTQESGGGRALAAGIV